MISRILEFERARESRVIRLDLNGKADGTFSHRFRSTTRSTRLDSIARIRDIAEGRTHERHRMIEMEGTRSHSDGTGSASGK